jgi:hypothetical protein
MGVNILAVGDICGQAGIDVLTEKLCGIKKLYDIGFTVVNGENAAGLGVTPAQADAIFAAGADVITLGNHTWSRMEICSYLDDCRYILRPSNFAPQVQGRGWGVFDTAFGDVCVINLIGRINVPYESSDNAFIEVDSILKKIETKIVLVDFHADATSEKHAMAYHLDGRVSALWGTHTHVQTSDWRLFPGGMGYITDIGMTGALDSIIGMKSNQPVKRFLGYPPGKLEQADGPSRVEAAVFEIDAKSGKCLSVEAIRVM